MRQSEIEICYIQNGIKMKKATVKITMTSLSESSDMEF